ncbi:MAG: DUF4943 family protein [Bacteroidales bacterium]|nr:DUF4943 family protein [Bacteroidales bacterium]
MKRLITLISVLGGMLLLFSCQKSEDATREQVHAFVENLQSGNRNFLISFSEECGFTANSIPYFLEYAEDETMVFAQASALSSTAGYVPLGLEVLWYVESIRTGGNDKIGGLVSLYPAIILNDERLGGEASVSVLPELAGYYKSWWKRYGNNPQSAVLHNPLEGTPYHW